MSLFILSVSFACRFVHASSSPDKIIFPFDKNRRDAMRERAPRFVGSHWCCRVLLQKKKARSGVKAVTRALCLYCVLTARQVASLSFIL